MRDFSKIKRIIIKIGSSSLVHDDLSINDDMINSLMSSFFNLYEKGIEVCLVSSGAIALGMHELGLSKRPADMALKQACAAVGQAKLMEAYNIHAKKYGLKCGQILLNHDDFQKRTRMHHLSNTLEAMFENKIIPIINENDALSVDEIKVGDNDTLAALIVPMINANLLILFSDIDGLFNKNPKLYKDAVKVDTVEKITQEIYDMVGVNPSNVGTGGMETKLNAAKISTNSCCNMIICNSNVITKLDDIVNGDNIGTLFTAKAKKLSSKKDWLIFKTYPEGTIVIDDGCKARLANKRVSILPVGIIGVIGEFKKGSLIDVIDKDNNLVARGVANYSSEVIDAILGLSSNEITEKLGPKNKKEVIHANNLVVFREGELC